MIPWSQLIKNTTPITECGIHFPNWDAWWLTAKRGAEHVYYVTTSWCTHWGIYCQAPVLRLNLITVCVVSAAKYWWKRMSLVFLFALWSQMQFGAFSWPLLETSSSELSICINLLCEIGLALRRQKTSILLTLQKGKKHWLYNFIGTESANRLHLIHFKKYQRITKVPWYNFPTSSYLKGTLTSVNKANPEYLDTYLLSCQCHGLWTCLNTVWYNNSPW